ncbi:hypothetical protein BDV96DRAFT_598576 [Lophiotrema nucula]|uniref:tRNA (uracil-O(2)-)-methyltransferase n=1 Tax=Lophiotrema nucula TaxID=690887 RepID=A0A6A5ZE34_9PLEO|nr:hypothetical protein BDV96DRAFT_598576 [Lophiotrema nucula]
MSLTSPVTDANAPLFSPDLVSPEVAAQLPEGYQCRPLRRSDYHDGFLDVLRVLTTVGDVTEEQWDERYEWISHRNDEYFLLCITDSASRIVGTGALIVERKFIHNLGLVGHIEDIAVAKDQQGKKLGLRVIQALDFVAEKVGCYKSILDCSEANEGFYVKCGFKRAGLEMAHYYGQNKPKVCRRSSKIEPRWMSDLHGDKFAPLDVNTSPPIDSGLPPELWTIVQSSHANFPPQYFLDVSRNLIENPNLTVSHLSRAEISYSSFADPTFNPKAQHPHGLAKIIRHLKPNHQPKLLEGGAEGYELEWTVVRKLIPRNPKLDRALLQSCHLFVSTADITIKDKEGEQEKVKAERYMVIYLPHVEKAEEIPFYHPKVAALAILYTYLPSKQEGRAPGTLSIFYQLFPDVPLDNRLERTALRMLEVIHKHSRGRQAGYVKRVHHDQIVDKKRFGDTYADLKGRYAQDLIKGWVEQTPPEKHVFEDLGIAAFLMELWVDMYGGEDSEQTTYLSPAPINGGVEQPKDEEAYIKKIERAKSAFPGFVDIGCGNGLLVHILNTEGWHGWGFDARRRKTWSTFPSSIQFQLEELLLVPSILNPPSAAKNECESEYAGFASGKEAKPGLHDGMFGEGMFIIANHADELTIWTPVLAYLSDSPFIAIPCCSHNFAGNRFRAPHKQEPSSTSTNSADDVVDRNDTKPMNKGGKQVSAYASFSSYITYLTDKMGYVAEKEHLRIPSTRNVAIIGRKRKEDIKDGEKTPEEKMEFARRVVEEEMGGMSIEKVREEWIGRGEGLMKGKGGGH